jgi:hypothetical protein
VRCSKILLGCAGARSAALLLARFVLKLLSRFVKLAERRSSQHLRSTRNCAALLVGAPGQKLPLIGCVQRILTVSSTQQLRTTARAGSSMDRAKISARLLESETRPGVWPR